MQVARREAGGEALMTLTVDSSVDAELLSAVAADDRLGPRQHRRPARRVTPGSERESDGRAGGRRVDRAVLQVEQVQVELAGQPLDRLEHHVRAVLVQPHLDVVGGGVQRGHRPRRAGRRGARAAVGIIAGQGVIEGDDAGVGRALRVLAARAARVGGPHGLRPVRRVHRPHHEVETHRRMVPSPTATCWQTSAPTRGGCVLRVISPHR